MTVSKITIKPKHMDRLYIHATDGDMTMTGISDAISSYYESHTKYKTANAFHFYVKLNCLYERTFQCGQYILKNFDDQLIESITLEYEDGEEETYDMMQAPFRYPTLQVRTTAVSTYIVIM